MLNLYIWLIPVQTPNCLKSLLYCAIYLITVPNIPSLKLAQQTLFCKSTAPTLRQLDNHTAGCCLDVYTYTPECKQNCTVIQDLINHKTAVVTWQIMGDLKSHDYPVLFCTYFLLLPAALTVAWQMLSHPLFSTLTAT